MNWILIVWGMIEALWGYAQLLGFLPSLNDRYLVTGSFFNPGPYCAFLGCIMPVAVYMALRKRNRAEEFGGWTYIIAGVALMPMLMGRTGWLAAGVGSAAVWWFMVFKPRRHISWGYRRIFTLSILIMAVIGAMLYLIKPASALGRVFIWMMAADAMWNDAGVGWSYVAGAIGEAQERYFASHPDSIFVSVAGSPEFAFNEFLQVGLAGGYLSLILFIVIPLIFTWIAYHSHNYGIWGSWIALLITCMGSYPLQFVTFRVLFGVLAVLTVYHCITYLPDGRKRFITRPEWKCYAALGILYMILVAGTWLFAVMIPENDRGAEILFERGKVLRHAGRLEESNEVLHEGLKMSGDPMFLNLIGRNMQDLHNCNEAERYYRRSINRLPSRLYPYYLLCKMYAEGECRDSAKFYEIRDRALHLDVKVGSPAMEQMLEEIKNLGGENQRGS
ncbi:MAG: O-antigen ligase family protein [Muribaculaceae bacterium]|nr:O-antigen ligase family protein [Muribaculaceae bacterium]